MRTTILVLLILRIFISVAQTDTIFIYKFSLDEAIKFAYENNLNVKISELEMRKAKWKIWETTAIGLPQVNASGQFQYYTNIPTQLMPDFLSPIIYGVNIRDFGLRPIAPLDTNMRKFPVQFGSPYNLSGGITITQILFNGEWLVGLQAARTFKLISEQNYQKARIELKATVTQMYCLTLIANQSYEILTKNYENINKIYEATKKSAAIGMVEQTQVDQLEILKLNIENQIKSIERQKLLAENMLKFQLGLMPQDSIVLSNTIDDILKTISVEILQQQFNKENNIDYQLINSQVRLKELGVQQYKAKYLPTIASFYSYSQSGLLDSIKQYDNKDKWHPTSLIGIKIEIPIFSSGQRLAAVQQQRIDLMETRYKQQMFSEQIDIQYIQYKNDFLNAFDNFISQEKNKNLSEKIYNNNLKKYEQGTSSYVELTQSQNQYLQSQASYYQTFIQLINSKTNLDKLLNR